MEKRIEVENEIRSSKNHEQFRYIVLSLIGIILPISLWLLNYGKVESPIWWGFFTVLMILITATSLIVGTIKTIITFKTMSHYRKVLTLYATIDERTHIPQTAIVTTCLRPDSGRFGFQKINYFFWVDQTELVFFPVRPDFSNSRSYQIVQSVRLNILMIRSYSLVGAQYDDGEKANQESFESIAYLSYKSTKNQPVYRDTRATLIAYAVGDQTLYIAFDARLHDRMKVLIPEKDKRSIEASEIRIVQTIVTEIVETPITEIDSKIEDTPLESNEVNKTVSSVEIVTNSDDNLASTKTEEEIIAESKLINK